MTYAVPVFVTDSALSSCSTPEASASVRSRTVCAIARKPVTKAQIVAYITANPGCTVHTLCRVFGLRRRKMAARLPKLRDEGYLRSEKIEHNKCLRWHATGKKVASYVNPRTWKPAELKILRAMYWDRPWTEILAALPGRTQVGCVERAARPDLSLKRKHNIGRDMLALQLARNPKTANVKIPPVTAPTVVRKAIARMTPLEAAWMGRLRA